MKKKYLAVIILIGLVIWGAYDIGGKTNLNTDSSQLKIGLEKGNLAPDFELQTLAGETYKLSDLRGKKVIVNFWATWCPPCRLEMPEMEEFYSKYKIEGIEILAINLTQEEKNRADVQEFIKEFGITFPVPMDEKGEIGRLYYISSIPTSFVIDTQGVIREKIVGPMTFDWMKRTLGSIN